MWPEMGTEFKVFTAPFSMHQASKLRNWIARPILNGFSCCKFVLKATNYSFQTHPKTSKTTRKWVRQLNYTLHPSLSINTSKIRNEIAKQALNGLTRWKLIQKAIIHAFQMPPRTLKTSQNISRNIRYLSFKWPSLTHHVTVWKNQW